MDEKRGKICDERKWVWESGGEYKGNDYQGRRENIKKGDREGNGKEIRNN